jgi:hypothetical protein
MSVQVGAFSFRMNLSPHTVPRLRRAISISPIDAELSPKKEIVNNPHDGKGDDPYRNRAVHDAGPTAIPPFPFRLLLILIIHDDFSDLSIVFKSRLAMLFPAIFPEGKAQARLAAALVAKQRFDRKHHPIATQIGVNPPNNNLIARCIPENCASGEYSKSYTLAA